MFKISRWGLFLLIRFLVRLYSVEILNRFNSLIPASILPELLRYYGASIDDKVVLTPPIQFHNLKKKNREAFVNLKIGHGSYCGPRLFLDLKDRVVVGRNVTIAMDVMLITHTDVANSSLKNAIPSTTGPIEIRDNSYIGCRTTILQDVTIGVASIIGAGSLVTKDVPPDSKYGGVPARLIGKSDFENH